MRTLSAGLAVALLAASAVGAAAQQGETAPASAFSIRASVKATGLISRAAESAAPPSDRTAAQSLVRFRVESDVRANEHATFHVAYEQRFHYSSQPLGFAGTGILPPEASTPFRLRPLVWRVTDSAEHAWRHEVDRANVQVNVGRAGLTVGRQSIGWGRGVMFTAVDLFAPFSPLEVDREWRAGVDAVRADIKLTDHSSIDVIGAFGEAIDQSAFGVRARGYTGLMDVEVVTGRRADDLFLGVTSSAAVGDAEVHGELAAFRVPSGVEHDVIWKGVAGGSYRFPLGSGILTYAEYHYSGFGAADARAITTLLISPTFLERVMRGDTQLLSRHAVGIAAFYEVSPEFTYSAQWLHNPRDRSGVVAPTMTYTINDAASILGSIYLPYGKPPEAQVLQSEYGAVPRSGLLQLRYYF